MHTGEKHKMCWNCEGNVKSEALYCPFCAADLARPNRGDAGSSQDDEGHNKSLNDSLSSLYRPPYLAREDRGYGVPDEREEYYDEELEDDAPFMEEEEKIVEPTQSANRFVWALLLLSLGGNLLTLGLLVFFFSEAGRLTLEWKGQFWFLYCAMSMPFLFFGWKCIKATEA